MKILLLGGQSALGKTLKPVLAPFAEVITAGRKDCDLHLDLDPASGPIKLPTGMDAVVNLAAHFGGKTIEDMLVAERVNVLGTMQLCQAAAESGVGHLVLISSIFATLPSDSPFYSIYAASKKHADEAAALCCKTSGMPLTILRPGQFYGTGPAQRRHQPFLTTLIERAASHQDIVLYGSNDARRNFIHVEDVAMAIVQVLRQKLTGVHVCMSPKNVTYSEIASAAIAAFNSRSTLRFDQDKPNIPDNVLPIDVSLYEALGWRPAISIQDGMKKEAAFQAGLA